MQKYSNVNQVSMSSIEPAAQGSSNQVEYDPYGQKVNTKNVVSSEMAIENELEISDIPQFTIGPGAMKAPSEEEGKPFESVQIESNTNAPQVIKQSQIKMSGQKMSQSKRNLLKKNVFESDMGLSTGRFENEPGSQEKAQQLSKSANQAKVLKNINKELEKKEIEQFEPEPAQENEMRETSYFKQQTDDERKNPKSLGQMIQDSPQISAPLPSGDSHEKASTKEGIQMFKLSSRSQMRQRIQRQGSRKESTVTSPSSKIRINRKPVNIEMSTQNDNMKDLLDKSDTIERQQSHAVGHQNELELQIDDELDVLEHVERSQKQIDHLMMDQTLLSASNKTSKKMKVKEKELTEIQKVKEQNEQHVTANFGALNIQKQHMSNFNKNNYSALKGPPEEEFENASEGKKDAVNQMFTSMSDIGFPSNIHKYNLNINKQYQKQGELLTTDQIQRMMDTTNNYRVRTKTIDEMLHNVQEQVQSDPEYVMRQSESAVDFFVQLLTDQNFKIVLNTLNILNMILHMPVQQERWERIMNNEIPQDQNWGLSNSTLGRHIPLIVKKLADSKNIIRQEAQKCLFGMNKIMRNGNKKDNNFIALILPYLNNSSNWHIREELLYLLIKCFLTTQDPNEFDAFQILDSILQLFNDTKEKIRNLALEAISAYSSIGFQNKISEVMFQLNIDKDICELVQTRLDYGLFPVLNSEGQVEIPNQEQFNNNFDVDSVAHSMTNQSHINYQGSHEYQQRRKQSVGMGSQKGGSVHNQRGGNSSGRKIVVATANATNQQLVSHHDEIIQQAFIQSKRTTSANNPNQFEQQNFQNGPDHYPTNSFSYSVGGNTGNKANRDMRYQSQFDELPFPQDLNGSSFLPKLQKVVSYNENQNNMYRERVIGSSGEPGYLGLGNPNMDPQLLKQQHNIPISGGNKRSNKYLHGTPGHQKYGGQFFGQEQDRNSGRISNHNMNNSISNKSPSLYDQQNTTLFDMSGNVGSLFGVEQKHINGSSHVKHMSNLGTGSNMGEQDFLSMAGMPNPNHQTPSSMYQGQQILYSAGGYRENHGDNNSIYNPQVFTPNIENYRKQNIGNHNMSELIAETSPSHQSNSSHINVIDGIQNYQQRMAHQNESNQPSHKKQTTFYSDGTAVTGITATTGATSQNRGGMKNKNKILMIQGNGPPQHNIQVAMELQDKQVTPIHRGPGPIKATQAANQMVLQHQANKPRQGSFKMRKIEDQQSSVESSHRDFKVNDSNDFNLRESKESDILQSNNRSFSYHIDSKKFDNVEIKEIDSAGLIKEDSVGSSKINVQNKEDPALLTQSSKIVYISTDELEPLKKPEKEFKKSIGKGIGINSDDWAEQFEGCNMIRRVCKHHQSLILQTGNQLNALVGVLIKHADSLRSAVSRIALMTLFDMFQSLKRVMEPCLDPVMKILLKKCADTNHFIAQEAEKCLQSLVNNCQANKVIQILHMQNMNSRQNVLRLKLCQCHQQIVQTLGNNILFFKENDKLLVQLAKFLQDANQDVRQSAKNAFVIMSQGIMGQNELEKLLQRVLNEVQYRQVKQYLDKEPTHLISNTGSQIDFVITNANAQNQPQNKKLGMAKQSFKNLRQHNGLVQKQQVINQDQQLNIQAKSILNPQMMQKQDSQGHLKKQEKKQEQQLPHDQFFIDSVKDLILKTQVNEWRLRHESSEALFDLIKQNINKFTRSLKMVELADAICKLLNDSNAKIQISALENFRQILPQISQFIETYIQLFYKSIIQNLGSSNVGVRKNSENILRLMNDSIPEQSVLLQPLMNMIQYNSNARLKPALLDQLLDILEHMEDLTPQIQKQMLPVAFKLLDDNKSEVKQRTEKLLKKLYAMIGQQVLDQCPQIRLQRVCDICLSNMGGSNSSGLGANGNQLQLNSRN